MQILRTEKKTDSREVSAVVLCCARVVSLQYKCHSVPLDQRCSWWKRRLKITKKNEKIERVSLNVWSTLLYRWLKFKRVIYNLKAKVKTLALFWFSFDCKLCMFLYVSNNHNIFTSIQHICIHNKKNQKQWNSMHIIITCPHCKTSQTTPRVRIYEIETATQDSFCMVIVFI